MDHVLESLYKYERKDIAKGISTVLTSMVGNWLGRKTKNKLSSALWCLLSGRNEIWIGRITSNSLLSLIANKRRDLILAIVELTCLREEDDCMQRADDILTEIEEKIQYIFEQKALALGVSEIRQSIERSPQKDLEIFSLTDGSTLMVSREGTWYRVQVDDGKQLTQNYHCARYSVEGTYISIYNAISEDADAIWWYTIKHDG